MSLTQAMMSNASSWRSRSRSRSEPTSRTLPTLLLVVLPMVAAAQADGGAPTASAPEATAPVAPVQPDKPHATGEAGSHRVLGGHRFEPSNIVSDPFSTSSVQTRFGYVYAKVSGPFIARQFPLIDCCKDVPVGGFGGAFDFSVRAADWLAFRADLSTTVYTGLDQRAIIVAGPGLRATFNLQVVSGLQLGDRFRVAGLLGEGSQPELNILVLSGLIDAINSGSANVRSIFDASNTEVFNAGVTGAVALVRSLGLVAEVEYVAPNKVGSVSSFAANGIAGAGQLDWNLRELWPSVPVGLSGHYRILAPINTSTFRSQQDFDLGIGYTGRPGLSARIEIGGRRFHLSSSELFSTVLLLSWIVRYDW